MEPAETGEPDTVKLIDDARVRLHTKQSEQAPICLGVRSYPLLHPDRYPLPLFSTVLGGGSASRPFTQVRALDAHNFFALARPRGNHDAIPGALVYHYDGR